MTTPTLREAAMAALTTLEVSLPILKHNTVAQRIRRDITTLRLALTAPEQSPADGGQANIDTFERYNAIREAHAIKAEDDYFAPRPVEDGAMQRRAFNAGFTCGFDARDRLNATPAAPTSGEPVAWIVYWGLGNLRVNSVHLEKATAEKVASEIKSHTEVHPLYAAPGATPPSAAQAEGARDLAKRIKAEAAHWAYMAEIDNSDAAQLANHNLGLLVDQLAALTAAPEKLEGQADHETALDMLCMMFDCYEDGPACYEDPDEEAGYLGRAVKVSNEDWHKIVDLLNRLRPRVAHVAAPAPHQQAAQPALNPSPLMRSCGVHAQSAALASACATPPSPQQAAQGGERERFEAEMRCEDVWGHRSLKRDKSGRYVNSWVAVMWEVWQAAQGERAGVGLTAGTELNVLMNAVRRLGSDKTNAEILASLGIVTTEGGGE